MAMGADFEVIHGVFTNDVCWEMDFEKLADLTSVGFAELMLDVFDEYYEGNRFNAQAVRVSGVNSFGDHYERIIVSLGHSFASCHYTYLPYSAEWYYTKISQEVYENIVNPFQNELNWRTGDGIDRSIRQWF